MRRSGRIQWALTLILAGCNFSPPATEGTRYALNGVLFDLKGDRLRLVATDGKRLALCERPVEWAGQNPVHVVVPNKGVQLLARLAGPDEETVAVKFLEGQLTAASARATLTAQLVQGHFPPYDGVIRQTGGPINPGGGQAVAIALAQPRPNPSIATPAILTFALAGGEDAKLSIVDARGRTIRHLWDGTGTGDAQVVFWDGLDDRGVNAPAGVYFARLTGEAGRAARQKLVRGR